MTQYCTLEEAYNVPTFTRKKKSCKDASRDTEAYDHYTEQKGKEQAIYEKFEANEPQSQPKKAIGGGRGMTEDTALEGGRKTYSSQMQDFNHVCKTMGICLPSDSAKGEEAFLGYDNVPPASSAPSKAPKKSQTPQQKCAPLNPPNYEYPLSDGDKERFRKALNVAIEEMEDSEKYIPPAYEVRKVDMTKVSGYVDEELENYMFVNDMKPAPEPPKRDRVRVDDSTTPAPSGWKAIAPNRLRDIPGFEKLATATATASAEPRMEMENFTKKNKIWMDLLLFIGSGILIIFLLEQLFKLAMITGMKKTVEAMEHILQESKSANVV